MNNPIAEYTVRDFSAVDKQIEQIAARERVLTQKLKLANLKQITLIGCGCLIALGLFIMLAGIGYRIAFPPNVEVVEKTEVVEKIVQPPKIIIQTPAGSQLQPTESVKAVKNSADSRVWGSDQGIGGASEAGQQQNSSLEDNQGVNDASTPKTTAIGSRSVTTFTSVPSSIPNYGNVVSGWKWSKIDAENPEKQYCYLEKSLGQNGLSIQLATKSSDNSLLDNLYTPSAASGAGITKKQWESAAKKCVWWTK